MTVGPPQPENFPHWMLLFSFFASLALTLLAVVEGLCRALRKATFEIALTREVFFRILETGESLYTNAVLVSYDTGALIQEINASLTKRNGATKTFTLRVAQIGEKYRTPEGLYQFSFHSTSPLSFVPPSNPQRLVFVCEHESYAGDTRQHFQRFQQNLYQMKERYSTITEVDQTVLVRLDQEVQESVEGAVTEIMDNVQIEPGKYTLLITATYRQQGKFLPVALRHTSTSKVDFTVKDFAREYFRYALREYLQGRARQVLLDQPMSVSAPEYTPADIRECSV